MTEATVFSPERQEIEDLLPWYVAGTLTPDEVRRVETAVAADPGLARSLALVREDMDAAIASNQALGAPSARAFERLAAAMEAEPRRPSIATHARRGFFGFVENALAAFTPRQLAYAAAAAVAVVAIQAAVIGTSFLTRDTAGFQTASQGEQATATGTYVLVAFQPAVSLDDVAALLGRVQGAVVDGPRAGGLFRVRLAGSTDVAQRAVTALQAETRLVRMVVPSR